MIECIPPEPSLNSEYCALPRIVQSTTDLLILDRSRPFFEYIRMGFIHSAPIRL